MYKDMHPWALSPLHMTCRQFLRVPPQHPLPRHGWMHTSYAQLSRADIHIIYSGYLRAEWMIAQAACLRYGWIICMYVHTLECFPSHTANGPFFFCWTPPNSSGSDPGRCMGRTEGTEGTEGAARRRIPAACTPIVSRGLFVSDRGQDEVSAAPSMRYL